MKKEDFIGIWKLIKYGEGKIHTSHTHLVVKDDILWEVRPGAVYYENTPGPEVKYNFEQGQLGHPSKVSLENGYKYLVTMDGDTLMFKLGPLFGYFPKDFRDAGNVGEYRLESESNSNVIGVLPQKVKVEEVKLRGLGTLRYNSNLNWWIGSTKFQGRKIILNISVAEEDKFEQLSASKDRLKQLELIPFSQMAAHHLLQLFNESWNDSDQSITAKEFEERIAIESITLETDGHSEIWFHDGDLFQGHSIRIALDSEKRIIDCQIAG
jgi:hypothetical protein